MSRIGAGRVCADAFMLSPPSGTGWMLTENTAILPEVGAPAAISRCEWLDMSVGRCRPTPILSEQKVSSREYHPHLLPRECQNPVSCSIVLGHDCFEGPRDPAGRQNTFAWEAAMDSRNKLHSWDQVPSLGVSSASDSHMPVLSRNRKSDLIWTPIPGAFRRC